MGRSRRNDDRCIRYALWYGSSSVSAARDSAVGRARSGRTLTLSTDGDSGCARNGRFGACDLHGWSSPSGKGVRDRAFRNSCVDAI